MNRTVLITGATSGIGEAAARAFAANGDALVLCGRRMDRLESLKRELEAKGASVYIFALDVRDRKSVETALPKVLEEIAPIDVLINNAGLARGLETFQESDLDDLDTMLDTNVKGLIYVTRAVLPQMIERDAGHIINIGSTAAIFAYGRGHVYCASKAAVKTVTDGIRIDTMATNIKVTNVQPGTTKTEFAAVRHHGDRAKGDATYANAEPLLPENVADILLYIANQPRWVQITDVTVTATKQAPGLPIVRTNA
ncbi:SDR family NAD(P)-dependent oxidoreductase [Selenomonas sp. TAMA-11512]|uniref:SDR family NAD(P)-dependent oxidoreductase n=1 Tax=Selenomonas sp. TAMA-11512 TaxID=3095337 RepID=UPI00308DDEDF|nr:SDR family NAD(P)-dependent oxidoreductase [Selenomonas sp. TAMA-11512]